jgi:hypothetical protein
MRNLIAGALAALILWTAGCTPRTTDPSTTTTSEGQKSQAPAGTTAARNDNALVRFINADPNAKGMDIWSSGVRTFSNVAYKMITPYVEMTAHAGQFQLREAGATQELAGNQREMFPGRHYTLVALPGQNHSSRLEVMSDYLGVLEPGQATVRLINATTDVKDLDLYIQGRGARIGHGVDLGIADSFTVVKPGMLEIRQPAKPALQQLSNLKVEADRLYTFIVTGRARRLDVFLVEDRINA